MNEPPSLDTRRLQLIPTRVDHAEALFPIWGNPDLLGHYLKEVSGSVEQCAEVIERMLAGQESGVGYRWSILLRDGKAVVGSVGYHGWEREHHRAELSYELIPEQWGHGYAAEAARAVLDFGFAEMGLREIVGRAAKANGPSIRILERLGFRRTGEGLREWGGREIPFVTFQAKAKT